MATPESPRAAGGLVLASRSKRVAAGTLDALPFVAVLLATGRTAGARVRRWDSVVIGLDALYTIGLTATCSRTLGQKALGLRVVDRTTGDRPTWRQSVVRWAATSALPIPASLLPTPPGLLALRELQPAVDRLRREFRDDPYRQYDEMMSLYRARGVSPWAGLPSVLLLQVAPWVALQIALHRRMFGGMGTLVVDVREQRGR